jgi:hypothetical protein
VEVMNRFYIGDIVSGFVYVYIESLCVWRSFLDAFPYPLGIQCSAVILLYV